MHITCVKGSPIIRSLLILILLVASGFGFLRLTAENSEVNVPQVSENLPDTQQKGISARYFLTLSAEASEVLLDAGFGKTPALKSSGSEFQGSLEIPSEAALIDLKIVWADETVDHRFAKLVIEAEGQKTFTHVFDSDGPIEDFVELPF